MVKEKVMMVKFKLSKIYAEENLGVTKDQIWFLHIDPLRMSIMINLTVQFLEHNMT